MQVGASPTVFEISVTQMGRTALAGCKCLPPPFWSDDATPWEVCACKGLSLRGRPAVECSEAHKTCPRPGDWGWAELIYDGAQITGPRVPRFRTARCSITTSSPKEGGLGLCNAVKRGQKTGAALADVAGEPGLSLKAIS